MVRVSLYDVESSCPNPHVAERKYPNRALFCETSQMRSRPIGFFMPKIVGVRVHKNFFNGDQASQAVHAPLYNRRKVSFTKGRALLLPLQQSRVPVIFIR